MERIKSLVASALIALVLLAGFGFGIMAIGFAIVLGGAFAVALRLAGPRLLAEAQRRAGEARTDQAAPEPAVA